MRILLIYPRYGTEVSSLAKLLETKIPPLGLAYLASALEERGHQVKIIDAEAEKIDFEELGKRAKEYKPGLIGISTATLIFKKTREVAGYLKKIIPQTPIVVGGPHLSSFPIITLEFNEFDFGIAGEGEITICELAEALEDKRKFEEVKGLVFRQGEKIIKTEPREFISNLDILPFPAWHLLSLEKYHDILTKRKRFATMISSRGCPFNCIYCDPECRMGKKFRVRSPENLIKEVELLYNKYQTREICFYDDTFTVDKERVIKFCQELIKKELDLVWECRTRVDCVNEDLIKIMKRAGCYRIRFGIEAANENILRILKKGINKEQIRYAFSWCKKYGIETFAYFMLGCPEETKETVEESINLALEINPDYVMFSPTLLHGQNTELFKWASENGYIKSDYWTRWLKGENLETFPVLDTEKLKKEEILHYTQIAYRKFYFRPIFIWKMLKKCKNFKTLKEYSLIALSLLSKKFKG